MKHKVLIIDGNILDVIAAEASLRESDFDVTRLTSPNGALSKLEYELPDVVLVDVTMERLGVRDILARLEKDPFTERVVIILFSHMESKDMHDMCVEHGLHAYFSKGKPMQELGPFVRQFFDETI
ncbi:MAG: response regulator [Deltaproteobacteria bacterium]|nr:MAG: response regulator [Deltaproteobacteria bacterium]